MVYLIGDSKDLKEIMLVKAKDDEEINERLKLRDNQDIIGRLTDGEVSTLDTCAFAVLMA